MKNMEALTIDFNGIEIDVFFDIIEEEPKYGIPKGIEVYKVEYQGCDVTDVTHACDQLWKIQELTQQKYEDVS